MIRPADSAALSEAASLLLAGQVVAIPTETVYGLAADALQPLACARIFEVKARPSFDPLIVHILDASWLPRITVNASGQSAALGAQVARLQEKFWPGPLTLILPRSSAVPDIVSAGLPTVAVRVPAHPAARALLELFGRPLAAPSANPFGYLSPTTALHVEAQLGTQVPLILDGGPCAVGVESSIVDASGPQLRLLRAGGISQEELEAALGEPLALGPSVLERPLAPGQLPSHYAPRTPLTLFAPGQAPAVTAAVGWLGLRAPAHAGAYRALELLSPQGDLREAAAKLFAALHRLDNQGLAAIHAEAVPETGLGRAIMDRLRKAEAHR